MLRIHVTSHFSRAFKKLPQHIHRDFEERIKLFEVEPFHPTPKTHKLTGSLKYAYAFYLRDGNRVFFKFEESGTVLLVSIGKHDSYNKWSRV